MKYRLKDRDLQKTLDSISGGDFTTSLQESARRNSSLLITVPFRRAGKNMKRFEAYFFASEIEEVPDYSPNRWNDPFEVEAPVGVPMRLEYEDDEGTHYARAVRTIENEWFDTSFENRSIAFDKARFRPWDDDECRSLDIGPEGVKTLLKALETVHYQPGLEYVIDDLREYLEAFPEAENFEEDNP